ncbi:MAG: hypothetical protein U9R42_12560 [Bacteroidota bacterium]|nr:hypothetical protein [Bacteroidota bacterium]
MLNKGETTEFSLYDICKINDNEFWTGGKSGILIKIDTLGNIENIKYANSNSTILKILKHNDYVLISTADGKIYKYCISTSKIKKYEFNKHFKKVAFYDMLITKNGNILVAGGYYRIAKGKIGIPKGVILKIDSNFVKEPEIVWKSNLSFVWSLLEQPKSNKIMASAYHFLKSKTTILSSENNGNSWEKDAIAKGLIHKLVPNGDSVLYSGCKNIFYKKNGLMGNLNNYLKITKQTGCIYSFLLFNNNIITCNNDGSLSIINKITKSIQNLKFNNNFPVYDIIRISDQRLCLVGHAKMIFFLDINSSTVQSKDIQNYQQNN